MMKDKSHNSGFTLVELLIVIAITAVLAGIGAASYFSLNQQNQLNSMGQRILGDIRSAASNAQSQENGQQWGVHFDNTITNKNFYSTWYGSSYASGTIVQVTSLVGTGISFTNPGNGTSTNLIFTKPYGIPSASTSITISTGGLWDTISVDGNGTVSSTGPISVGSQPAPTVTVISPNSGTNNGNMIVTYITGTNFVSGANVYLTLSGQPTIDCSGFTYSSSTQLSNGICPLSGVTAGSWNVVVTNPSGQSGTLAGGLSVSSCFLAGTEISTPNGNTPIQQLKVGDIVWSYNGKQRVPGVIEQTFVSNDVGYFSLQTASATVDVTGEHPFFTTTGLKKVKDIQIGDELMTVSGPEKVISNTFVNAETKVYNFEVSGLHNYYANGFLVHNKP